MAGTRGENWAQAQKSRQGDVPSLIGGYVDSEEEENGGADAANENGQLQRATINGEELLYGSSVESAVFFWAFCSLR